MKDDIISKKAVLKILNRNCGTRMGGDNNG